ncbi:MULTISPECIES: SDR family NAD(P)-dependent oxidoreductase [Nocardia]|uniref:SDR family NAD(P)-dependent oxidoreductase n=1 Tax=Nocardia TaxID=1817 RepID=UPI001894BAB1|nr:MULTISPECIES: SDR family NAD(P)-dependent oxidoreductase [Nocardia]MBF6348850.1 SDR family NAD(P)-dependent oxidoreductase [Nocardia flavorosea]
MKTVVITGGTDGIGRSLAYTYLERGDRVVIIGRSADKARTIIDTAARLDAADRLEFLRADLALTTENHRVLERLRTTYPAVDILVLGARYYRSTRSVTAEGFEASFALFYLSRHLLTYGLADSLERAATPMILDLSGPGGELSRIRWDDLQFTESYDPDAVMHQCGKLSDLLAVGFTDDHPHSHIRYLLLHPGLTSTGFTGEYSTTDRTVVEDMRRRGQPVEAAVARIMRRLDNPPAPRLSAYMQENAVDTTSAAFDLGAARRLRDHTRELLATAGPANGRSNTGPIDSPGSAADRPV